ncbi:MAG: hypothetical protein LBQ15_02325 [Clostridium sp.]|nr:hypothetical protein [Clostridium sp.]
MRNHSGIFAIRKTEAAIVALALAITVSACSHTTDRTDDFEEKESMAAQAPMKAQLSDIQQLSETDVGSLMKLDDFVVSLAYNANQEVPINHSIGIYGLISVSNDADTVKASLTERFDEISLYSEDECVFTSEEYTVDTTEASDGIYFVLQIAPESSAIDNGRYHITDVILGTSAETDIVLPTDTFWVSVYSEAKNGVNIIESPVSSMAERKSDQPFVCSYFFLTVNKNFNSHFTVSSSIPEKIGDDAEVSILAVHEDPKMEETTLETLKSSINQAQSQALKVYDILVSYQKMTKKHLVMQPVFSLDITGEAQTIGSLCPLTLY